MSSKIFNLATKHKFITVICILVIIISGYFGYKKIAGNENPIQYVAAAVERGALIVSVSGSGQVSASNQVDIKPKVSGDVVYVGVKNGQELKAGTLLAQIDIGEAEKAVRDAETDLETAKLELDKLLESADELDLLRAENDFVQAKESKQKAEDNIIEAYEDAFNTIADAFLDLPTVITGLRDVLYSYEIAKNEITISNYSWNMSALENSVDFEDRYELERFIDSAVDDYVSARKKYDENFENYKNASRYSNKDVIEALLNETAETTRAMAEAVKSEVNMLDFWTDYRSQEDLSIFGKVTEYQSDLKTYTAETNSHLLGLLSIQRHLQDGREDVLNAERLIEELELSFAELITGADELNIRAKEIIVQQKEDALLDAKEDLRHHYIYAPFGSVVAEINIDRGDLVSSNSVIATLITQEKIAEISLNEVDVAKLEVGQKATLTFDALPELIISGEVIEVDAIGQVSQGVVSYGVKISFDIEDEMVKSGMSVTADIITDARRNVLVLPNSAIICKEDICYVELVDVDNDEYREQLLAGSSDISLPKEPKLQIVEVGLSNDLFTEIISGLEQGDIVTLTTNQIIQTQKASQNQGFQMMKIRH